MGSTPSAVKKSFTPSTSLPSPSSMDNTSHLPPRSSSLTARSTSSALDRSLRDAPPPLNWMSVLPRSKMKTSPELRESSARGADMTRTLLLPLTCSSVVVCASLSTLLNAESTPPSRYRTPFLKSCKNSLDSDP